MAALTEARPLSLNGCPSSLPCLSIAVDRYRKLTVGVARLAESSRMESDCRLSMSCLRPRILALHLLFWGLISLRVFGAALLSEEKTPVSHAVTTPCWQVEEFVVSMECALCNDFQSKTLPACKQTGYVEKISCAKSNKGEYKSCRSPLMEERLFWKFEGAMVGLTIVFALMVVARQRSLDRLASEKVRRQIESI
ncbi:hypothetical protein JZ751_007224 [Albula glossodonta]|uniref:Protein JTB n=1 Tax=Albula glossodonta TaxID=121402 RepID=A0A8T2N2J5_9TELE|nr:hypothetical protein JZ751_007224 [Albula glossodonta]